MHYRIGGLKLGDTVIYIDPLDVPRPAEIVSFIPEPDKDGKPQPPRLSLIVKNTEYHDCIHAVSLVEHGDSKKQWLTIAEAEKLEEKKLKTKEQVEADRAAILAKLDEITPKA